MDTIFLELGQTVLERWKQANFSLDAFPGIATAALNERPPADLVDLDGFVREFLLSDEQPNQSQSGFGQPEIIAYEHSRFYIQLLFWLDGTTEIHQHEFSGAFHVMAGSSIHAHYRFENAQSVTPYLRVGDVRMNDIELLETGRTVAITSGRDCIHSLFHLETPSVTVVIRTQHDPGTGPQFNYLPPHLAVDPHFIDALTLRRNQLLDVLEQTGDAYYPELVREMIAELDFERGYHLLRNGMGHLQDFGEWEGVLEAFQAKHGELAAGIPATLAETVRREGIKEMRRHITEPEHRFFLALLMNASCRADLLTLVARRYPDVCAEETILRWAAELADVSEFGVSILDVIVPETVSVAPEVQEGFLVAALGHFLSGKQRLPSALKTVSKEDLAALRDALAVSSLKVLLA